MPETGTTARPTATGTPTNAPMGTQTPTATPDEAPRIVSHSATPEENGQALAFSIEAEDDTELASVRVSYGDENWVREEIGEVSFNGNGRFSGLTGDNPENGRVVFLARDYAGQESRKRVIPDEQAPVLSEFRVGPTETAGEVALTLQGEDEVGLEKFKFLIDGNPQLRQGISGETQASVDTAVDVSGAATVGENNTLTVLLEDWNGNTTQTAADTYVRKYDKMEDTRLDIGANYFPMGQGMFDRCLEDGVETHPAVAAENYGGPINPWVTSRHIDQMQGHGIERVQFTYEGTDIDKTHLQTFLESQLASETDLEPTYFISGHRWTENADAKEIIEEDMTYLKENLLSRDNTATFEGRPTVYIENAQAWVGWGVTDEWQSYEAFVNEMIEYLTVDGTEPLLVAGMGAAGWYDVAETDNEYEELASNFDGVMNGVAPGVASDVTDSGEKIRWEDISQYRDENFQGLLELAREHDMEFFPRINAGFNDQANTCWGSDHVLPRSPEHLYEDLQRGAEYGTADRMNIFTWNDFTEGTAIEPGTFRGNNYGNAYVDTVKEFQQSSYSKR